MSVVGGGVWMNSSWWGLDEQDPVVVEVLLLDEQDPDQSSRLGLDEQDPVEGWMNRTSWRAGSTIAGGGLDEQ